MNKQIEKIRKFATEKRESMTAIALVGYQTAFNEILVFIDDLDESKYIGRYGYFYDSINSQCEYGKLISFKKDSIYPFATDKNEWKYFSLSAPEHLK